MAVHDRIRLTDELAPPLSPLISAAMCGRFSITGDLDFYAEYFAVDEVATEPLEKSWNVAPTDRVYVVTEKEGRRTLGSMSWGLIPHWAKDDRSIHINARSETVAANASFRESFAGKRCLIPADGFYEWETPEKGRVPHWVYRADGHPLVFAGIWAARLDTDSEEWSRTCAILTREARGVVRPIHDRMPITLDSSVWDGWLDRDFKDTEAVLALIREVHSAEIAEHAVSSRVNTVTNNGPELRDQRVSETLF